jgi:UDP-4-amino-4,6-dideoxy-N-acetyl-beta-L-altrosamine transaminase
MREFIPYGRQYIDEEDIRAVVEVLRSDYITTGPKIAELENRIAEYTGAKHAVVVSNGTAALHAACFAAGIEAGDEVITTPMTFAASANCILYMGAKPVFADIDSRTYNIDPKEIERKITEKTKAIIPVHFTGQPCDMDEIMKIAEKNGLTVIEDGAHALGAEYKGRRIGTIGSMTTFSFHPVKHITTGEGGAITTNDDNLYEKLIMFRTHGITRDKDLMNQDEGPWYYEQHYLGYNYRITDIQAALGISQMNKLESFLEKRRSFAAAYNKLLRGLEGITVPYQADYGNSAWHIYIIRLNQTKLGLRRREVFEELRKRNIGVNVHYIPVYYHPYFRELGYEKGICPVAEELYEEIITLPLYPAMELEDIYYIVENIADTIRR